MKPSFLRPLAALLFVASGVAALIFKTEDAALATFTFTSISEICPLGSLESMLASKILIPRALIALGVFFVLAVIFGRFLCGWACPVPWVRKFLGQDDKTPLTEVPAVCKPSAALAETKFSSAGAGPLSPFKPALSAAGHAPRVSSEIGPSAAKKNQSFFSAFFLKSAGCASCADSSKAACSGCPDSRNKEPVGPYVVLGAALVSTAAFSFPVFCLICPVGLTFAVILSVWHLAAFNEPSLTALLFIALLAAELLLFKKWCSRFCPIGALISIFSRFNKTFRPTVQKAACLRTQGIDCKKCAAACPEGIDLRGEVAPSLMSRCIKCGQCAEACPSQAISFPLLAKFAASASKAVRSVRKDPARIPPEKRAEFIETSKDFTESEAKAQAARCTGCAKCVEACPLHNEIPEWLQLTSEGNFRKAAALIYGPGRMPELCSRICPQERLCEGACPMSEFGGAVPVGALEKFVAKKGSAGLTQSAGKAKKRDASVAVIGAGPAGLAAADALSAKGLSVAVFDEHSSAGGLLTYGIPSFKLDKGWIAKRAKYFKKRDIQWMFNTHVGKDISLEEVLSKFDAVLLTTGAGSVIPLCVPGSADCAEAVDWKSFLELEARAELGETHDNPFKAGVCGKKVVVLGGGDTAMDCARTALRLKAESVTVLVRRPESELRTSKKEFELAKEEGAKFLFETFAVELIKESGRLCGLRVSEKGKERTIAADFIITAFGYAGKPESWLSDAGVTFDEKGRIVTSCAPLPHRTANPKIFAAGDAVRGAALAVYAVGDALEASASIETYLEEKLAAGKA